MKILGKLLGGFLLVAALCGLVGTVGVVQLRTTRASLEFMGKDTVPTLDLLAGINLELIKIKVAIRSIAHPLGLNDPVYLKRQRDNIAAARTEYGAKIQRFEELPKIPEEAKLWKEIVDLIPQVKPYTNEVIALAEEYEKSSDPADRDRIVNRLYQLISGDERLILDDFLAKVDKLIAFDRQYYAVDLPAKVLSAADAGVLILILVSLAALVVAVSLGVILGRSISGSLSKAVSVLDSLAAGEIDARFVARTKDEFLQLSTSLTTVSETVGALISEAGMLTEAAAEGRLSTRGDANKFKGGYHDIVDGVNRTLDAVIGPLNVAAAYVDRISKGDIPPKITDSYNGDFNLIKNNLNVCIDAVGGLVADAGALAQAAVEGRLSTRADASRHQGDFRRIVEGVNRTLDLVIDPINETTAILKRMAEGDLTTTMTGEYKGDFDILKTALNDTIDSINDILGQVAVAVDQVTAGSQQVSQASQSLSQGATEQASSLEEITSSVTEIAGQTRQNTENAVQVNGLSRTAKEDAERGNAQMQDLVSAMSDINASAEEIRKIVKAIDDISFQINLLALNANVEAARAGKYGKGFAVVAEEVRNLAVRSAGSVKETTAMVDGTIANIGKGNALVEVTAKQLASIVEGSAKVAGLAEEVATASREQSQGLEQISTGLNQIDQVTQANTANSEESASAAEELSSQAQQLKAMVGRFKLRRAEAGGRMSNADMIAMLRAELAAQGGRAAAPGGARALTLHQDDGGRKTAPAGGKTVPAAKNQPAGSGISARGGKSFVNPADVISLDDDDFGKF
jgi:methyl-accepting chemotaxis protein